MSFRENIQPKTTDELIANFARVAQTSHYKVRFEGIEALSQLSTYLRQRGVTTDFIKRAAHTYVTPAAPAH